MRVRMVDFRRYIRPFFLTPKGEATRYKPFYDLVSYLATQTAFCFATAPFVLLTLPNSLRVWARVYFYCVIGTAASMIFFSSNGKLWLIRQLEARKKRAMGLQPDGKAGDTVRMDRPTIGSRTTTGAEGHVGLGLPDDPEREIQEAVEEIKQEVEIRRRRGSKIKVPTGVDMKAAVEERLGKKLS